MEDAVFDVHGSLESRHWWFKGRHEIVKTVVRRIVRDKPDMEIADIGCGTGGTVGLLADEFPCWGVDSSERAITIARRTHAGCRFELGAAAEIVAQASERIGLLLLMDVLEHIKDDGAFLGALIERIQPGTDVLITVPARRDLWSRHDVTAHHCRRYHREDLEALFAPFPVECRLITYFNARLFPIIWMVRKLTALLGASAGRDGTDFAMPPAFINSLLAGIFAGEAAAIVAALDSPSERGYERGVSLMAVVRRRQRSRGEGQADMHSALEGKKVVVLTPTLNDWTSVATLVPEIDEALASLGAKGHVVIIDDGSTDFAGREAFADMTLRVIERVDEISLTKNQGNQRAIAIGLGYLTTHWEADFVIVMDSDHEDRPSDIPALLRTCAEQAGQNIIFAARAKRFEGWRFRYFYALYRALYRALTGRPISVGNFSALPWHHAKRLANVPELWAHFPASIMRARIPFTSIPLDRGQRRVGGSSMNLVSLVTHAFSGFAVFADVVAVRTLFASVVLGLLILVASGSLVLLRLFSDIPITGWTSIAVGLLLMVLVQVVTVGAMMLFFVLIMRMQPPLIPARTHSDFIFSVIPLYGQPPATTAETAR